MSQDEYVGVKMQFSVRVLEQEGAHGLGFMRREIVCDDVNRSSLRLTGDDLGEEIDKGATRVPRDGLAEHFTGLGVEGGEQAPVKDIAGPRQPFGTRRYPGSRCWCAIRI